MATYIEFADFPVVVQQKLTRWGVPETPTATRDAEIAKHETKVQSMINSFLSRRFPAVIPFTVVSLPNLIKYQIALPMVIHSIAGDQQAAGESYVSQNEKALNLLSLIARGEVDVYSEADSAILSDALTDSGIMIDTSADYDEEQNRVFPRPAGNIPSSEEYAIDTDIIT